MADTIFDPKVIRELQKMTAGQARLLEQLDTSRYLRELNKIFAAQAKVADAIRLQKEMSALARQVQQLGLSRADVVTRQILLGDAAWQRVLASPTTSAVQRAIASSTSVQLAALAASGQTTRAAREVLRLAESNQGLFDQLATEVDADTREERGTDSVEDVMSDVQAFVLVRVWMVAVTWAVLFEAWLKQLPAEARAKYGADAANIRNMLIAAVLAELINKYAFHR